MGDAVKGGKRIYRQKSYQNKPLVVYEGTIKLGSFRSFACVEARYPDAVFVEAKGGRVRAYETKAKVKRKGEAV